MMRLIFLLLTFTLAAGAAPFSARFEEIIELIAGDGPRIHHERLSLA